MPEQQPDIFEITDNLIERFIEAGSIKGSTEAWTGIFGPNLPPEAYDALTYLTEIARDARARDRGLRR